MRGHVRGNQCDKINPAIPETYKGGICHVLWRQHFHVLHGQCFPRIPGCQISSALWATRFEQKFRRPSHTPLRLIIWWHADYILIFACEYSYVAYHNLMNPVHERSDLTWLPPERARGVDYGFHQNLRTQMAQSASPCCSWKGSPQAHVGGRWCQER